MSERAPTVSVITATYNRSNVLRCTIESLLASEFEDWEQIVVGDGCTDDTAEVVRAFADSRIRFVNLPRNTGDEAEPHNEGLRQARGRTIAYLNHDDLWMPDHLGTALRGLEETGADLVFTLALSVSAARAGRLLGLVPGGTYLPVFFVPQSTWLARRTLLEEIGPWRPHGEVWTEPPQDLLVRAWRAGKRLLSVPRVTVVKVHAGVRPAVYAAREGEENLALLARIVGEPDFLARELARACVEDAAEACNLGVWRHLRRAAINATWRAVLRLHLPPIEVKARLTHRRRGAFIERWRRTVGLPPRRVA